MSGVEIAILGGMTVGTLATNVAISVGLGLVQRALTPDQII